MFNTECAVVADPKHATASGSVAGVPTKHTATDSALPHRSPLLAGIDGKWMIPGHISAGTWRHRWDATPRWESPECMMWWRNCSCGARKGAIAQTWTLRSALLIFVF